MSDHTFGDCDADIHVSGGGCVKLDDRKMPDPKVEARNITGCCTIESYCDVCEREIAETTKSIRSLMARTLRAAALEVDCGSRETPQQTLERMASEIERGDAK